MIFYVVTCYKLDFYLLPRCEVEWFKAKTNGQGNWENPDGNTPIFSQSFLCTYYEIGFGNWNVPDFFSDHKWCGNSDRFAGNGKNIGWKYGCYVPNCRKKLDNSWFFPLLQSTSTNLWKMQSQQWGQCGYLYSSVSKVLYSTDNLHWVQQNCQYLNLKQLHLVAVSAVTR